MLRPLVLLVNYYFKSLQIQNITTSFQSYPCIHGIVWQDITSQSDDASVGLTRENCDCITVCRIKKTEMFDGDANL